MKPIMAAHIVGVFADRMSADKNFTVIGFEQSDQHAHGGGLACAVGTDQAENLAAFNVEADVVHGNALVEALGQFFDFNDRTHGCTIKVKSTEVISM